MTPFLDLLWTAPGYFMRALALIILISQLAAFLSAYGKRWPRSFCLILLLQVLFGVFCAVILLDARPPAPDSSAPAAISQLLSGFYELPWLTWAGVELLELLTFALSIIASISHTRRVPDRYSIKCAMDTIPDGICISDPDGTPLLQNLQMTKISLLLTGHILENANHFLDLIKDVCPRYEDGLLYASKEGRTYLFTQNTLSVGGRDYCQLLAADVTRQYELNRELQGKNDRLRSLQDRIRALGASAARMAADREILNARIAVHDQLGTVLLTGKYYFDHPESTDPTVFYRMIQEANLYLMREAEGLSPGSDPLTDSMNQAEAIGIRVEIAGELPRGRTTRDLLGNALRQCTTNTIKHAGGDRVTMTLKPMEAGLSVCITNSGSPPAGPITESGGLASLRAAAETAGVLMSVDSVPRFALHLLFPPE